MSRSNLLAQSYGYFSIDGDHYLRSGTKLIADALQGKDTANLGFLLSDENLNDLVIGDIHC